MARNLLTTSDAQPMEVENYLAYECNRDGSLKIRELQEAMKFLRNLDLWDYDDFALEIAIMHCAFLVDPENAFENNSNIKPSALKGFQNLVSLMRDSDVDAWTRKLHELAPWKSGNRRIANLLRNWIIGTLNKPEAFL